jgi:hypothetical protein
VTSVLLVTSNGTGMGHLTRQAAVALALPQEDSATILSLSIGLPVVLNLGVRGEYCPSYERGHIDRRYWESYLRDRVVALAREVSAAAVVFDGVAPYLGLGRARLALPDTRFVWLRRGMWRPGTGDMLRRAAMFDLVVEPGDLARDADRGPTADLEDAVLVEPVSLLEVVEPLSRKDARVELGLPSDGPVGLVTLGTGRLGDVAGPGRLAVDTILGSGDTHLAVTQWAFADREVPAGAEVTTLRGVFPLARYLSAFDFAVSSAGYNAVHELVPAGLPTLFVANTSTRTDDQVARSTRLAELGLALHARDDSPEAVEAGVRELLDPLARSELAEAAAATRGRLTGARQTGEVVVGHSSPPAADALGAAAALDRQSRAREAVKRLLGERGTNLLRRALGRAPRPVGSRLTVTIVDRPAPVRDDHLPLAFTEELAPDDLKLGTPVEHLLAGSSVQYRRNRRDLIAKYYRVRAGLR